MNSPQHFQECPRLVSVQPLSEPPHRIRVCYDDGVEGVIDLSHLTDRGVFKAWNDHTFFEKVRVGNFGLVCWPNDIDLCPDALYMQLTGISVENYMPGLRGYVDA